MIYVFLGAKSELPGVALTEYGQAFEIDEMDAERLIRSHPPALIIPESEYLKLADKSDRATAWKAMHDHRETVNQPITEGEK